MSDSGGEKDILSVEDVGEYLGVGRATVWRWCREGRLSALKVGKHWRIRRKALEAFLRDRERPTTLVEQLDSFLRVPDSVLAVAQDKDILHRLDAAFFRVGAARGGLLVKFYGGEEDTAEELISRFEDNGLAAGRLRREGRLLMRSEEDPLEDRRDQLGRLVEKDVGKELPVWASFDWIRQVDLKTALEQQESLSALLDSRRQLIIKTAALEEALDGWSASALKRAQYSHSGTIFASEDGLSLSRWSPMPTT